MYQTLEEVYTNIQALTKERILMNIEKFDLLMKRVNLEEDMNVKNQMLAAINQYLVVLGQDAVKVEEQPVQVANVETAGPVETVKEDVVAGAAVVIRPEPTIQEVAEATDKVEIIAVGEPPAKVKEEPTVVLDDTTQSMVDIPELEAEQEAEVAEVEAETVVEEAEVVEEAKIEKTFVEEFGLISTASDDQMSSIIANGGYLYQEKRSFMLNLFLTDELVAVAKTISLNEFPDRIKHHMKTGGVVTCDVIAFTEPKKRSRGRYTDVTFANLKKLDEEDEVSVNIKSLIETGQLPEHAKAKLAEEKEEVVVAPVKAAPVVTAKEENAVEGEAAAATSDYFIINPNFVGTFENQKLAVLQQQYGIKAVNGVARLFTNGSNGPVIIGVNEKSSIVDGDHLVKITDYELKQGESHTLASFIFQSDTLVDVKEEAAPEVVAEEVVAPEPTPEVVGEPVKVEEPVQVEQAEEVKVDEAVTTEPSTTAPETAENLLNKPYIPEEARELINPTAGADLNQGYQDLVTSQSKDMGGAIEQIRTQTEVSPSARQEITGAVTGVISQTLRDTNMQATMEAKSTTAVMGNIQDGAGNLTVTETVIQFATTFNASAWQQSVGKEIPLVSRLETGSGPMTTKLVQMIGKQSQVVGQGRVPITEALLMDGNQHTAKLIAVENVVQQEQGYVVSLRFGEFKKVA